jgi:hypothetical protein
MDAEVTQRVFDTCEIHTESAYIIGISSGREAVQALFSFALSEASHRNRISSRLRMAESHVLTSGKCYILPTRPGSSKSGLELNQQ